MRPFGKTVRSAPIYILAIVSLLVIYNPSANAQEVITTQGKLRIQPVFPEICVDSHVVDMGQTDPQGRNIKVSGAGIGGGIIIGYGLAPWLDIDLAFGYVPFRDAEAPSTSHVTLNRSFYLITLMYRIPVLNRLHAKLGVGGGLYKPENLQFYSSTADYTIRYKNAIGTHVMAELEYFVRHNLAVNLGAKYYSVTYREDASERNGAPGYYYGKGVENLNGSGVDFMGSFAFYF